MTSTNNQQSTAIQKQGTQAIVEYGEWTEEAQERESREMSSGGKFWKPPVGRTAVRFLPPKVGWPSPFVVVHQHFIKMPGLDRQVIFHCPKQHAQLVCKACQKADALEASGNAKDSRMAENLRPGRNMLANVIVNAHKPELSKMVVWSFGKKVYDQLKAIKADDENGGNFLDPIKGFTIAVNRTGTGKDDTVYMLQAGRGQSQLHNMDWIEMQPDLRKSIRLPTVEQQERLLDGEDPRDVWGRGGGRAAERESSDVIDVSDDKPGATPKRTAEDDLFDDDVDVDV